MNDCVFCAIVQGDISTEFLYESAHVVAFRDIHPIAPVHVLIIPKKHIASINDVTTDEQMIMGEMIIAGQQIARDLQIADDGYKLLFRTGVHGGQEIAHVHLHLIGGAQLTEQIHPV